MVLMVTVITVINLVVMALLVDAQSWCWKVWYVLNVDAFHKIILVYYSFASPAARVACSACQIEFKPHSLESPPFLVLNP
jgi:hypothetical protein